MKAHIIMVTNKILFSSFLMFAPILLSQSVNAEAVPVNTFEELKIAISSGESEISINSDFNFTESLSISSDVVIEGNNHTIKRDSSYLKGLFSIVSTGDLEINNLTIDGGAPNWAMDYENRYYTQPENKGYIRVPTINTSDDLLATVSLITNNGSLKMNQATITNTWSSVTGSVLKGTGSTIIANSLVNHNGSKTHGGAFYLTGGTLEISNSQFVNNVGGVGTTGASHAGAIYASDLSSVVFHDNTLFEDNYAQSNGGAAMLYRCNVIIKNTVFRHNMGGNDGSALDFQSKVDGYGILIEDTVFEKNIGLATTGQSMGTIWLEQWRAPEENPITIRNVIFRENVARTGGAIADAANGGKGATNVYLENVEIYENEIGSGGLAYVQGADYVTRNLNVHNNNVTSGSSFYIAGDADVLIEDAIISNNVGTSSGVGAYCLAGSLTIKNSEISNNISTGARGGGIFVRGYYTDYDPSLILENTIIRNNTAATTGGGIAVFDNADVFSSITIDDKSKIYDNKAGEAGDDFSYTRVDDSENTSDNTINLDNISIAGIRGIDGWYNDNADDRFDDTDNPTVFTAYKNNDGTIAFYLKAAGLSTAEYDGNGGEADAHPIVVKYGQTYVVDNNIPTRDGYVFVGWNTRSDGTGISLKAGDAYDGSDGYTLYAIWEKIDIVVPATGVFGAGVEKENAILDYTITIVGVVASISVLFCAVWAKKD